MRTTPFADLISWSWERMKVLLFRPFDLKKWLTLLLIAFLAGALGSSGGNGGGGSQPKQKQEQAVAPGETQAGQTERREETRVDSTAAQERQIPTDPKIWVTVSIIVGIIVVLMTILFSWLHGRFEFVWLNSLINNSTAIKQPFHQFEAQGKSLFKVYLVFGGIWLVVLMGLGMWAFNLVKQAGIFENPNAQIAPDVLVQMIVPVIAVLFPLGILSGFAAAFINFSTPLMFRDQIPFSAAFQRVWSLFGSNIWDFFLFWIVNFLLLIAAFVFQFMAAFLMLAVFGLIAVIIFGILYLLFVSIMKAPVILGILVIVLGIPVLFALIVAVMLTQLPVAVYFRYLLLSYLASHGPEYAVTPKE